MSPKSTQQNTSKSVERPPVVVVMGHIDHGKSKLLDYIRKTNVVEGEAGGITQHLSAYEVLHKNKEGNEKKITFLDTPGHEAFKHMRHRGAEVADIAILVIAADEGVKAQTLEAYKSIEACKLPFVIAINKIDKPHANVEKTKNDLLEHGVYLEGLGGEVPWTAISAKEGTGIDDLLNLILLVAELEELSGDPSIPAEGIVIEAHRDPKKGIAATLIIKNGTLQSGSFVASGESVAPTRIMEDFLGNSVTEITFSSPVHIVGFNTLPEVGSPFNAVATKKEAENLISATQKNSSSKITQNEKREGGETEEKTVLPLIVKADVSGSLDAIEHEINAMHDERVDIKVVHSGVGNISENDIKTARGILNTVIIGFHTATDKPAQDLADRSEVVIKQFDIIYKLTEWIADEVKKRRPKKETEHVTGQAKILKTFSKTKNKQVVGGKVLTGELAVGEKIKILRRDAEIGRGSITGLQQQKAPAKKVAEDNEFGAQIEAKIEIASGDIIESFSVTIE